MAITDLNAVTKTIHDLAQSTETVRSEDIRALFEYALRATREIQELEERIMEVESGSRWRFDK